MSDTTGQGDSGSRAKSRLLGLYGTRITFLRLTLRPSARRETQQMRQRMTNDQDKQEGS